MQRPFHGFMPPEGALFVRLLATFWQPFFQKQMDV